MLENGEDLDQMQEYLCLQFTLKGGEEDSNFIITSRG